VTASTGLWRIRDAGNDGDIDLARELMRDYQRELGIDLCFQGFESELAALPGDYTPPAGRLLLAWLGDECVGCVALRALDAESSEMKRLYLKPEARGHGRGRALATACIEAARAHGYTRLRLDTLPVMQAAIALYRQLGFEPTMPYRDNPVDGALFFELDLTRTPGVNSTS
jgi:ribosomal protein S18 acetylase RimI-like enzyme